MLRPEQFLVPILTKTVISTMPWDIGDLFYMSYWTLTKTAASDLQFSCWIVVSKNKMADGRTFEVSSNF